MPHCLSWWRPAVGAWRFTGEGLFALTFVRLRPCVCVCVSAWFCVKGMYHACGFLQHRSETSVAPETAPSSLFVPDREACRSNSHLSADECALFVQRQSLLQELQKLQPFLDSNFHYIHLHYSITWPANSNKKVFPLQFCDVYLSQSLELPAREENNMHSVECTAAPRANLMHVLGTILPTCSRFLAVMCFSWCTQIPNTSIGLGSAFQEQQEGLTMKLLRLLPFCAEA